MEFSRREFVTTGLAGAAGVYAAQTMGDLTAQAAQAANEDGYKLWLRFAPPSDDVRRRYFMRFSRVAVEGQSPTAAIIREEMRAAVSSIVGSPMTYDGPSRGDVVVGTPTNSETIRGLGWDDELASAGPEGFVIRTGLIGKRPGIAVASQGEIGALYGAYHFLRLLQTGQPLDRLDITERPKVQLRMLNHWDNMDGSIERGYAGRSLWQWNELPGTLSPRYVDYARANASVGINCTVINSVNANVLILTPDYLAKVAALANLWRPYGLRVYLSANFAAPIRLGGLRSADPLDPGVIAWWKSKAEEIYKLIPDFGGFLVKANSEGQPGPKDYGRNHAEGANCLADAVASHGGNVIWRAFIYDEDVDPDRAKPRTSSSPRSTASSGRMCSSRSRTARSISCLGSRFTRCLAR